jgi:hypothetical protein
VFKQNESYVFIFKIWFEAMYQITRGVVLIVNLDVSELNIYIYIYLIKFFKIAYAGKSFSYRNKYINATGPKCSQIRFFKKINSKSTSK